MSFQRSGGAQAAASSHGASSVGAWGSGVQPDGSTYVVLGLSDTTSALGPLPLNLAILGMPGCLLQVDPAASSFVSGAFGSGSAVWSLPLPNSARLLGQQFFVQGGVFDPTANAGGFTVSNAGACVIGGK